MVHELSVKRELFSNKHIGNLLALRNDIPDSIKPKIQTKITDYMPNKD